MLTCPACGGLTPNDSSISRPTIACLHCAVPFTRRARWLATLVGATGTMLLAACYGPSGRYYRPEGPQTADRDGDGSPASLDCDDNDPTRYPGAADPDGDGIDQNCDGVDGSKATNQIAVPPPDGGA
ncbi:MAG: putative metal-binding motif-containing protein [Kofleriaceae bacterium]